jgi:hypothetical protein
VDLVGLVPGTFVYSLDGFFGRGFGQAVDRAGLRVGPGALEVHILIRLDCEVGLMGLAELLGRDAVHTVVDVNEGGHRRRASVDSAVRAGRPGLGAVSSMRARGGVRQQGRIGAVSSWTAARAWVPELSFEPAQVETVVTSASELSVWGMADSQRWVAAEYRTAKALVYSPGWDSTAMSRVESASSSRTR